MVALMSDFATAPASSELLARVAAAKAAVLGQRERLEADLGRVASEWKDDGSRVTATDHAISEAILHELGAAFPEDALLSEDLPIDEPIAVGARFAWVLDPIDGTNNFAIGLAQCAISLGLFENGEPVYGVIYDVSRGRLMHGGPGLGMWDGERRTTVRERALDASTVIGFHSPHDAASHPGDAEAIMSHCKVRALGSSALHLAYVAAGLLDGVVDHNVKLWDIAAGIPMIRAAGGDVTFLDNAPLPLRRFDVRMPRIFYVGGAPGLRTELATLLGRD